MPAVRERKRKMVKDLIEGQLDFYEKSGAELIWGSGRFIEPQTMEVTSPDGGAMLAGLPHTALRDAIFSHPTMVEGFNALFAAL